MVDLYLASQSPRRRELLTQIGVIYTVLPVDVPEKRTPTEAPSEYVQRLALEKSHAGVVFAEGVPVLGSDTIVVHRGQVLEKPSGREQAISMLMALSESSHEVMTAVAVSNRHKSRVKLNSTLVTFRRISEHEAASYWLTGEPRDKAGGYGIQGLGGVFVTAIKGSYSSVVGLPLADTAELLAEFGVPVWQ